jgi:hypothetical protein
MRSGGALDDLIIRGVGLTTARLSAGDTVFATRMISMRASLALAGGHLNLACSTRSTSSRIAEDTSSRMAPALAASSKRKGAPPNSKALTYTLLSRVTENT